MRLHPGDNLRSPYGFPSSLGSQGKGDLEGHLGEKGQE